MANTYVIMNHVGEVEDIGTECVGVNSCSVSVVLVNNYHATC